MLKNWKPLSSHTFTEELEQAIGLSVVFFMGEDCSSCKTVESELQQIDDLFVEHSIPRFSVDIRNEPKLAEDFKLVGIPAFVLFKAGRPIKSFTSYPGIGELRTAIISQLL